MHLKEGLETVNRYRQHWRGWYQWNLILLPVELRKKLSRLQLEVKGTTTLLKCQTRLQARIRPTLLILLQAEKLNRMLKVTAGAQA